MEETGEEDIENLLGSTGEKEEEGKEDLGSEDKNQTMTKRQSYRDPTEAVMK